ncbi:MAG TPA: 3-methyl-2-oxobutanoate hydroxymethyltransferase [Fibrobacteria bacterium]|jgi:3-methyl-2-oxobutanoate hydroxymethyltransferase|nr:3-methyl-2-oxobutanoate hydroxymethyltransferase [Fibrobacteria bacterium]
MLSAAEIARHPGPLVVCTACDFPFARVLERAGVDVILVGDSLANVALGLHSTRGIGMTEMEIFAAAVLRGAPQTHVTVDLPFGADSTVETAVRNGSRFIELGASSVKLEGSKPGVIKALVDAGIPVMGHLGVLPQTAKSFKKVGGAEGERDRLVAEAREIRDAGVFAMVLENVDAEVAREVTATVDVPTIGIGAGAGVRGQVQVLYDILGLAEKSPPFAKRFADLSAEAEKAVREYAGWVRGEGNQREASS